MLSKPVAGWTNVKLGDFYGYASYLTDVPVDFLEAFIDFFQNKDAIVTCDEEGSEFVFILNPYTYEAYVIADREELSVYRVETRFRDLAKELISDIEKHIDEWAKWLPCVDEDANRDTIKERKEWIILKIMKLKALIK